MGATVKTHGAPPSADDAEWMSGKFLRQFVIRDAQYAVLFCLISDDCRRFLGCMIPPILFFAMEYGKRSLFDSLTPMLFTEGVFAATFTFVYLVMKHGRRIGLEKRRQELQALRALRETLLNTDE